MPAHDEHVKLRSDAVVASQRAQTTFKMTPFTCHQPRQLEAYDAQASPLSSRLETLDTGNEVS